MIEKWQQLAPQERRTFLIGVIVLCLIIPYYFLYRPLQHGIGSLEQQINQQQSLLTWLKPAQQQIIALRKTATAGPAASQGALLVQIEQSLKTANLEKYAQEVRQTEQNNVRIRFKQVSFDSLVNWLIQLRKANALQATQLIVTPLESPGSVEAMVVISRQ